MMELTKMMDDYFEELSGPREYLMTITKNGDWVPIQGMDLSVRNVVDKNQYLLTNPEPNLPQWMLYRVESDYDGLTREWSGSVEVVLQDSKLQLVIETLILMTI